MVKQRKYIKTKGKQRKPGGGNNSKQLPRRKIKKNKIKKKENKETQRKTTKNKEKQRKVFRQDFTLKSYMRIGFFGARQGDPFAVLRSE